MTRVLPAKEVLVSSEDVSVEQICFEHALSVLRSRRAANIIKGYVEATLAHNPGLAARGMVLPLGITVRLPEFAVTEEAPRVVRLWDDE